MRAALPFAALTAASLALLPLTCTAQEPDHAAPTLVPDSSAPFGSFNGVRFLRHTGTFRGETELGAFRMPYEIVAPAAPELGNGTVLLEPPHFTAGMVGRDVVLGRRLLFGSGLDESTGRRLRCGEPGQLSVIYGCARRSPGGISGQLARK